ncbi:hypothetical protein GQR58_005675 [Nymphon striatum]|nr:hypothetical protein GQR58_005675 [Nymphon striatum]
MSSKTEDVIKINVYVEIFITWLGTTMHSFMLIEWSVLGILEVRNTIIQLTMFGVSHKQCVTLTCFVFHWFFNLIVSNCHQMEMFNTLEGKVFVIVPKYALKGQTVRMDCIYDLQESTLYAVKWYKDGLEIYRHVPKARSPTKLYPIEGVDIHVDSTKPGAIILRNVEAASSGVYGCEVSGESPHFHTKYEGKKMIVNGWPEQAPEITGGVSNYHVGDILNLNCTSPISRPAPKILWLINDRPVRASAILVNVTAFLTSRLISHVTLSKMTAALISKIVAEDRVLFNHPVRLLSDGLEQSQQEIKFIVKKQHFRKGKLEVKCAAVLRTYSNKSQRQYSGSSGSSGRRNDAFPGYRSSDIITLQSQYFPGQF